MIVERMASCPKKEQDLSICTFTAIPSPTSKSCIYRKDTQKNNIYK